MGAGMRSKVNGHLVSSALGEIAAMRKNAKCAVLSE